MIRILKRQIMLIIAVAVLGGLTIVAQAQTSLSETYSDWVVHCNTTNTDDQTVRVYGCLEQAWGDGK